MGGTITNGFKKTRWEFLNGLNWLRIEASNGFL